uniref:VOC domain-containing protein n=1 Tax=Takifugu rubripes TaxID=31033 RepID=A0A674P777_TAKRU
ANRRRPAVTVGGFRLKTTCQVEASHLDHLVLTVRSVTDTVNFYTTTLGVQVITFKGSLGFGQQKFNLHQLGQEFEPKAKHPTSVASHLKTVTVERTGAVGTITTLYFRDPDHNLTLWLLHRNVSNHQTVSFFYFSETDNY